MIVGRAEAIFLDLHCADSNDRTKLMLRMEILDYLQLEPFMRAARNEETVSKPLL